MAKVINQSVPFTDSYINLSGEIIYFGEQYRWALKQSTPSDSLPPNSGLVSKNTKGLRPSTRVKRRSGLWYDRTFHPVPFNPSSLSPAYIFSKVGNQTASRAAFKQLTDKWNALSPEEKQCWYDLKKDTGAKCSTLDVFIRYNLTAFYDTGSFDEVTCPRCPALSISYTTQQMLKNQTQLLYADPPTGKPFSWVLSSGVGTLDPQDDDGLSALYTAPAWNDDCDNPVITLIDRCDQSADLSIAVNAWVGAQIATRELVWGYTLDGPCTGVSSIGVNSYFCDGTLHSYAWCVTCSDGGQDPDFCCMIPTHPPGCSGVPNECSLCAACTEENLFNYKDDVPLCQSFSALFEVHDERTPTMKVSGCCPQQLL